jgi:hypothetical protein
MAGLLFQLRLANDIIAAEVPLFAAKLSKRAGGVEEIAKIAGSAKN